VLLPNVFVAFGGAQPGLNVPSFALYVLTSHVRSVTGLSHPNRQADRP
jgi:hypothetical protein